MISKMTSVKSRLRLPEKTPEIIIIIIFTHLKNDTEKSVLILICAPNNHIGAKSELLLVVL